MDRAFVAATLLLCTAVPAAAQTKGRVSVGASVTYVNPTRQRGATAGNIRHDAPSAVS